MACKTYCVYKHVLPNNKIYIGITKQNPLLRWKNGHGYKHCNYFYNAILKYGWLNVHHEILRDNLTVEEANNLEKYYIKYYRSYDKELSKITNDLFMPTDGSVETLEKVDKAYGTNYKKAASAIAFQDMANRGKYVKHQQMYDSAGNPIYGRTTGKVDQPTIEDMTISLNPDYYLEGTANHEISHLADALVNKAHSADATNNYMEYLLDRDNIMSYNEIRQSLMDVNPNTYRYLTTPSENKAHMIQLKRGMQKEGLINNWTDPITQDKIEEYLSYRSKYANRVNPVLRTLYDIRPDKQGFINRMNNLTPIEWAVPLGLPTFFGEEQENK